MFGTLTKYTHIVIKRTGFHARGLPVYTVHLGVAVRPTTVGGAVKVIRDAAAVIRNDRPCLIVSNQMSSLQS